MNAFPSFPMLVCALFLQSVMHSTLHAQSVISSLGIYSVTINSSSKATNGPVVNIPSGRIFRMIFAAQQNIRSGLPAKCGIIVNNPHCTNVYVPAIWVQDKYDYDYHNPNFIDCTFAGPCRITFTNSTGYSLLHTFQISAVPSSSQTDY